MDMMDISCDLTPPDLTPLTPVSVNCSSSTSSSSLSSPSVLSTSEPDQPATVTGRKSEAQKTLNCSSHQATLLQAAHSLCESQQYTDLHIQCEDGTIRAHQMMLAVASPFLKQLFKLSGGDNIAPGVSDQEPVLLVLPETKVSLVQALLHFLYTGCVVTKESQFYSLMKLVYALNINASIDAESTSDSPTLFNTVTSSSSSVAASPASLCTCGGVKTQEKEQLTTKFDIDCENNLLNSISLNKVNSSGLAVNSFTASGVVVKEEMEEKPGFLTEVVEDKTGAKTDFTSSSSSSSGDQLGHFVSVTPQQGFQIKMEIPGSNTTQPSVASNLDSSQSSKSKQSEGSDDPLAAIMNQTIFGGDNLNTMFIQVNTNSYLSAQNSNISTINANIKDQDNGCKEEEVSVSIEENFAPIVDDDDLNQTYNCETCNKPFKGKVMLQAHKYQEHHDNPDFEASSFPEDKYACRVCLKLFTRNSDVKAHILRVHCGDRRYPCQTCGKRFKESTHLRKHLYTHTGERPHFCSLCAKGFQTSSDLKRHKKTRIHQEKVEQAAGNTVAAITAANNAANAAAADGVCLEYDWSENTSDDANTSIQPRSTSLPVFPATVSLPTVPCPPEEAIRVTSVSNTFTTTASSNFINQNTQPYTNNSSSADQKPSLWPAEDSTISTLMMSPGSLQVQNCSLPSTTLDLSDIKWGILEQDPVKREPEKQLGLQ